MRVPLDWLKEYIDCVLPVKDLANLLTMSGLEVESIDGHDGQFVFELGVTPNRSDCLSIIGVAREVALLTNKKIKKNNKKNIKTSESIHDLLKVDVKSKKTCPRYSARIIKDIKISPSPKWLVKRLESCGIRSVNNVVDATNYLMLELGQPFHAFDYEKIKGRKIIVKNKKQNFDFITLDKEKRKILSSDLLICDAEDTIALAGVMGGQNSEVSEKTTTIVLESAYFEPTSVRRTSKRLGLISESSKRFERGVDFENIVNALNDLTGLICELTGGVATKDVIDIVSSKIKPIIINLDLKEVKRILGVDLGLTKIKNIVSNLEMIPKQMSAKKLKLTVPSYRPDLTRPIDIIEEIARVYGYDKFKPTLPKLAIEPINKPKHFDKSKQVREILVGLGFSEVVTLSFSNHDEINLFPGFDSNIVEISNPLSREYSCLPRLVLPSLLNVLRLNVSHQRKNLKLFAIQPVYAKLGDDFEEKLHISGVTYGKRNINSWETHSSNTDFYDIKGMVEAVLKFLSIATDSDWQRSETESAGILHPGKSADLILSNKRIGFIGQLHPDLAKKWDLEEPCYVFEFDFKMIINQALAATSQFSEISKFPYIERDMAILIDENIPSSEILRLILNSNEDLVSDVRIFDVYKGKGIAQGKKSMAYSIKYASNERTLTDEEVNKVHFSIVQLLEEKLNVVLRT